MLKTIGEMDDMLTATLSFARDEATSEISKRIDIGAFVSSTADDMTDAGMAVQTGQIESGVVVEQAAGPASRSDQSYRQRRQVRKQ